MSLNPFKKKVPMTEAEKIEQAMIFKYNLTKDPKEPNLYWLNSEKVIRFIPSDNISRENAEKEIQEYYRSPQLTDTTDEQKKMMPTKQTKDSNSAFKNLSINVAKGMGKFFQETGDSFMQNAPKATHELENTGMGTMRDGVRNSQNLGSSVNMGMRAPTVDDGLAGINPKIDMDTILGQVKKEPVKRATKKPQRKTK